LAGTEAHPTKTAGPEANLKFFPLCSMPYALCSMLYALCSMPSAQSSICNLQSPMSMRLAWFLQFEKTTKIGSILKQG